jgi:signal transduction histidine kinase/CheY-like chemotaxis protein
MRPDAAALIKDGQAEDGRPTAMTRFERTPSRAVYLGIAAVTAAVFVGDALTALGVAVWTLYLAPIALTYLSPRRAAPLLVAGLCSILTVAGYFVSPGSYVVAWLPLVNRAIGIAAMWALAAVGQRFIDVRLELRHQDWLRAASAQLAREVEGDMPVDDVAAATLRFVARYLDAVVGVVHVIGEGGVYRRAATYALAADAAGGATLHPGEGIGGQAIVERRPLVAGELPPSYLDVASSVGHGARVAVVAAPALRGSEVEAVVQLGFTRAPYGTDLELLELLSGRIAAAIRSALDRERVHALLEQTQQQSEELRVANEELQEQGAALRASQVSLEQQQAELEATNEELAAQARELEAQRAALQRSQRELQERATELERANRYKSEFLANMSHELRTPLNSSLILAKLLAENRAGNLTADQVRYARTIHDAGNELLALINDLLDLSRIEAGRVELHPEPVPIARVVEQLAATFDPVAAERGVTFEKIVEPGAPAELRTDAQRLLQILQNLLSNAFKFTERGGVILSVAPHGANVSFRVRDTGIGIAPEKRELIFDAFRQADGTTSRKYGGTGLGLSIARDLARLLGGDVSVESAPGLGSTFTLELPALLPEDQAVARPAPAARASGAAPEPPDAGARDGVPAAGAPAARGIAPTPAPAERIILVVEDDARFSEILCALAHEQRFECVTARTAAEGIDLALARRPSAILLDVGLPDHSGLSVLQQLKRNPATRHIPIHVVSVHDYARQALEMGAVGYVLKPAKREELIAAFARIEARLARTVRRILLVEDDPRQQEALARLLSARDVETVAVAGVEEALARLRAETFDCMVMDLVLSDGTGYDLLDRLERDEVASFPPVIVYTGRSLTRDDEQRLRRYSRSIVIKGARSPERLLDEVTLFLHQVEAELPPDRRRMLAEARTRDAAFEGRTILVVEDDIRNVYALSSVLEARGASVVIARNGREAVEAAERRPDVDLVLMDIMMPEMDGYEATQRLRAQARFARLPIIAVTARARPEDTRRCLAVGANDYIAKPIDVDKLLSLIRVWMPR